jgi:hypothetical protein
MNTEIDSESETKRKTEILDQISANVQIGADCYPTRCSKCGCGVLQSGKEFSDSVLQAKEMKMVADRTDCRTSFL